MSVDLAHHEIFSAKVGKGGINVVFTCARSDYYNACLAITWASTQQNLSSVFPTKRVSNQSLQLQRLARKLKFHLQQVYT